MKSVAVSALCLLGVLFISAVVEADYELDWKTAGELPCGKWDCKCAFKQKRGCCCAANDIYPVDDRTYTRMIGMWYALYDLKKGIEEFTENQKVAFTATLNWRRSNCFGPFTSNVPIPYNDVTLNHGNGYNPALGAFTAPRAGLYSFSFTAFSDVGLPGARMYHQVRLMRDGEVIASVWEDNREDWNDSGTQTVFLQLMTGCQVYVELLFGRQLCNDNYNRNTFSGYLINQTS